MRKTETRRVTLLQCIRVFIISLIAGAALLTLHLVISGSSRSARAWECEDAGVQAQTAISGTILISPTVTTVNVGETVTVEVWLENVADYYGVDFRLYFDSNVVEVPSEDVTPLWDLFDEGNHSIVKNKADNVTGTVWYAVTNLNPAESFTGTGRVCSIAFRAREVGTTTLDIYYAQGSTRNGEGLYPVQVDGEINVNPGTITTTIPLTIGWNLISVPLIPPSTAITEVLSSIDGDYDLVYAYDSSDTTDPWRKYDVAMPPFLNTLTDINETMGFWIRITETVTLTVNGLTPVTTDINLLTGWNLVGYPSKITRALTTTLQSIDGTYDLVYAYYAADTTDPWRKYDVAMPSFLNTLTIMEPGHGYWIRVTEDCVLTIDYE
jgi:hypothetical protein